MVKAMNCTIQGNSTDEELKQLSHYVEHLPEYRCTMIVKHGLTILTTVAGEPIKPKYLDQGDINKIIETEQLLERLFGMRFHIDLNEIVAERKSKVGRPRREIQLPPGA